MNRKHLLLFFPILAFASIVISQNCSQNYDLSVDGESPAVAKSSSLSVGEPGDGDGQTLPSNFELVLDKNDVVCDPTNAAQQSNNEGGLKARLKYLSAGEIAAGKKPSRALDYFKDDVGVEVQKQFFFQLINTPLQLFDRGFYTSGGEVLKNASGSTLVEYFSLQFSALLKLVPGSSGIGEVGQYELATISDDGSVLEMDLHDGQGYRVVVDNDGTHSERLRCASRLIDFTNNQKYPMRYTYYQGPANRIANMLLVRRAAASVEPYCQPTFTRYSGFNDVFFVARSTGGSVPTQYFQNLLSRGWKVVPMENFELPNGDLNPCTDLSRTVEILSAHVQYSASNLKFDIVYSTQATLDIQVQQLQLDGQWTVYRQFTVAQESSTFAHDLGSIAPTGEFRLVVTATIPSLGNRKLRTVYALKRI